MKSNESAISIQNVSKSFKLPHERSGSIKGAFVSGLKRRKTYEKQNVLKNIDFEVKTGEFFGVVGRNGSGKSTLLKLIAGIYSPDAGHVHINGKLTPFIELGVGFNPELTGRENVFLNGALLGFGRPEMEAMYDEIVGFAELEKFMDQKLKNYSSGMQVRLAFSIAIQSQSDILLFDEVLAVGDANFQRKCYDVFKKIKTEGRTVILVTHDMSAVEQYCDRAILIEAGNIVTSGSPKQVTKDYNDLNIEEIDKSVEQSFTSEQQTKRHTKNARIASMWLEKAGKKTRAFTPDDSLSIRLEIAATDELVNPVVGITIMDQVAKPLFATNTKALKIKTGSFQKGEKFTVKIEIDNVLSDGNYYVIPAITSEDTKDLYDSIEEGYRFSISGWDYPAFVLQPKHSISIDKN